jgi:hypothetical protein
MKAEDVILRLQARLPLYTDKFTQNSSVSSMSRSGTTVTVQTATDHNLAVGGAAFIDGVRTPISIALMVRSGTTGALSTLTPHDITCKDGRPSQPTVIISGANEPEFNGEFEILEVVSEVIIRFSMEDSGPTSSSGTRILENGERFDKQYNGLYAVSAVNSTTEFEYEISDSTLEQPVFDGAEVRANPRVSGAATPQRALDAYTAQGTDELWGFVVLEPAVANKSRQQRNDSQDNIQKSNRFRQQMIEPLTFYVFFPTSESIAARQQSDDARDIFRPVCQSILFDDFDSGLYVGAQNPLQFVSHSFFEYNTAFYIHGYSFEMTSDLSFEDTVGYADDCAFDHIDFSANPDNVGTETISTDDINLRGGA